MLKVCVSTNFLGYIFSKSINRSIKSFSEQMQKQYGENGNILHAGKWQWKGKF